MKKWIIFMILCLAVGLTGCRKQEDQQEAAVPTVQIAYAAYQYDQGYTPVEGWMYDMTISAEGQIAQLNALLNSVQMEMLEEEFIMDTGYRLTFRDAEGNVTRDMLILKNGQASIEGSLYQAQNMQELTGWLDALRLEEQSVGS